MNSIFNFKRWGRHAVGVFYVFLVVILWVSSSELIQSIFDNKDFDHPFFLTYFSTALFMIYCPFFARLFYHHCTAYYHGHDLIDHQEYASLSPSKPSISRPAIQDHHEDVLIQSVVAPHSASIECVEYLRDPLDGDMSSDGIAETDDDLESHESTDCDEINTNSDGTNHSVSSTECQCSVNSFCIASLPRHKLSMKDTFKLSAMFCPVWFLMNYTFNVSLNMTSVASNTILSTMSGPFSLLLSRCLLNAPMSIWNVGGVLVTLLGAVFIGYLDGHNTDDHDKGSLWGDVLALVSAFIYGCYVTLIKFKMHDESAVNMPLFFGFLGFINFLSLWPFLILLDVLRWEQFVWPQRDILALLTLNGLISVGSDYFWAQSILYTSPVVATVGLTMMMPVAMIADEIFRNEHHSLPYWAGSLSVMMGFLLVNVDFKRQNEHQKVIDQLNSENTTVSLQRG